MNKFQVIVIGGGAAGVSACCELAKEGMSVALVEQFSELGGVVYRHAFKQSKCLLISKPISHEWGKLKKKLDTYKNNISLLLETNFLGIDGSGIVMLKNRKSQTIECFQPDAVIIATGAMEKITPFAGSNHPNIITAGGLQVSLKSCKKLPFGDIVLGGSGPLLLAVASQLVKLGKKPLALIESGHPYKASLLPLSLPTNYIFEGLNYFYTIMKARIPIYYHSEIQSVSEINKRLEITFIDKNKIKSILTTDTLALHNGLSSNNIGLPEENNHRSQGIIIKYAGDCKQIMGSLGSFSHGRTIANKIIYSLMNSSIANEDASFNHHIKAQKQLEKIYTHKNKTLLKTLPDDTIICRCEQQTIGDLKAFCSRPNITAKEIKLNGRFTMGRCQGRFCASNIKTVMTEYGIKPENQILSSNGRWPVKPTSISALSKIDNA